MSTPKTLRGARRRIQVVVVAALAAVAVGLATYELRDTEGPHSRAEMRSDVAPVAAMKFDHRPTLLVVGDSYAAAYPFAVADAMDWSLAVDTRDGTGFVSGADDRSTAAVPFGDRLGVDAATYHVDYVLIDGGRNDLDLEPQRVVAAADEYVDKVHSTWPSAKIIIILPTYATPDVASNYPAVAEGLSGAAERVGGYVIDPVAQRWYNSDVDAKGLGNSAHLYPVGDSFYANKVVANLKQMFDPKPTLLVAGDSFAAGVGDPNNATYPYLLAGKMGWNLALDAQGGTGFASGIDSLSPPTVPFIDRLGCDEAIYSRHVDYVLVDGGRSDLGLPPEEALTAADGYIKKIRSDWPKARIVIILPNFPTPVVAEHYPALAEGLRHTAESVGADVIDPVAQRWYSDVEGKTLMWRDGAHLNSKGDAYYAGKVADSLKRMGFGS
jgi:lysophospholipase L1-like esterase